MNHSSVIINGAFFREINPLGSFWTILTKGVNLFLTTCFFICTPTPFRNRIYSKMKAISPKEHFMFYFKVDTLKAKFCFTGLPLCKCIFFFIRAIITLPREITPSCTHFSTITYARVDSEEIIFPSWRNAIPFIKDNVNYSKNYYVLTAENKILWQRNVE